MPLSQRYFIDPTLVHRAVTFPDGTVDHVHFRRLGFVQVCAYQEDKASPDPVVRHAALARMLAQSVCEPDGSLSMTYEEAVLLAPKAASALLEVVLSLNDFGVAQAKKPSPGASAEGIGSGTPSPSPSAVAA